MRHLCCSAAPVRSSFPALVSLVSLGALVLVTVAPAVSRAAPSVPSEDDTREAPAEEIGEGASRAITDDRVAPRDDGEAKAEHLRVGVLGGVGFPRPLSIEAVVKLERTLLLGLEYSALPSTTVNGVLVGWHALALDARVFPFQGAFFLGARVARQHLDGSATVNAGAYGSYSGAVAIDTWYLEPRLGLLWTFRSGITVGIDAGLEVPLQKTATASLPAGVAVPSAVASVRDLFGASTLPTVTLLSLGAAF